MSANEEFVGYVAMTGEYICVTKSENIEKSNYYDPEYEKLFSNQQRESLLVIPIKNQNEMIIGVLELINYQANDNEVDEKYLADIMSYAAGIVISKH